MYVPTYRRYPDDDKLKPSVPSSKGKLYKITEQLYDENRKPTTTNEYYAMATENDAEIVNNTFSYTSEEVTDPEKKATHTLYAAINAENDNEVILTPISGGRRSSKSSKKQSTRRRRSSKARKSRKSRTTRRR